MTNNFHHSLTFVLSLSLRFLTQRELRLVHWRQQVEAELRRSDGAESLMKGRALSDQHTLQKHSTDDLQRDRQEERKTGRGEGHGGREEDKEQGKKGNMVKYIGR